MTEVENPESLNMLPEENKSEVAEFKAIMDATPNYGKNILAPKPIKCSKNKLLPSIIQAPVKI